MSRHWSNVLQPSLYRRRQIDDSTVTFLSWPKTGLAHFFRKYETKMKLITSRLTSPKKYSKECCLVLLIVIVSIACAVILSPEFGILAYLSGSTSQDSSYNFHPRNVSVNWTISPNNTSGSSEVESLCPEVESLCPEVGSPCSGVTSLRVPPHPAVSPGTTNSTEDITTGAKEAQFTPPSSTDESPTEANYVIPSKSADPPSNTVGTTTAEATSKTDGYLVPIKAAKLPVDAAGAISISTTQPPPTTTPLPSTIESSIKDYDDQLPPDKTAPSEKSIRVGNICGKATQKLSYAYCQKEPSDNGTSIATGGVESLCHTYLEECHCRSPRFRYDAYCSQQEDVIIDTNDNDLFNMKIMEQTYSNEIEHYQ